MLQDNEVMRRLLSVFYPGVEIIGTPGPSGQRLVYFASFKNAGREAKKQLQSQYPDLFLSIEAIGFEPEVVIKISNGSNISSVARVEQEVNILQEVESQYYPTLYHYLLHTFDPETESPLPVKLFISIEEKIEGQTLSESMSNYPDESSCKSLLIELLKGLEILWGNSKQYVHRDLKPDNILVRNDGSICIIDLGIVRETGADGLTYTVASMGPCTPAYASPEQLENKKHDISYKSDLFSLGIIIYEVLSGQHPFRNEETDIVRSVLTVEQPRLLSVATCSESFSNVIDKMLNKLPYKRYRQIETLINDLGE